MRRKDAGKN